MKSRLQATAAAITVLLVAAFPGPSGAEAAGGANNIVIATNATGGAVVSRDHVQIAYDPADTVANQNIAIARSSDCVGCRTVAVAMQIVVVESSPSDFEPGNAATATNGGCDNCQTYAFAFQHFIQPGRVVYLSGSAQQDLAQLRAQVDEVTASSLSYVEMASELDRLFSEIVATVDGDLQVAGTTRQESAVAP